jgi:hypothetical protein
MPQEKQSSNPAPEDRGPPWDEAQLAARLAGLTAHVADGEERAELAAHLEDTVRAYVSGEKRVSLEDALLLARAHFGPSLQPAAPAPLPQQLLAAASATVIAWTLSNLFAGVCMYPWLIAPAEARAEATHIATPQLYLIGVAVLGMVVASALVAAILLFLRRAPRRSLMVRPLLLPAVALALLYVSGLLVDPAAHMLPGLAPGGGSPGPAWIAPYTPLLWDVAAVAPIVLTCVLWLWFTGAVRRDIPAMLLTIAACACTVQCLIGFTFLFHRQSPPFFGVPWSVSMDFDYLSHTIPPLALALGLTAVIYVARALVARRFRRPIPVLPA